LLKFEIEKAPIYGAITWFFGFYSWFCYAKTSIVVK